MTRFESTPGLSWEDAPEFWLVRSNEHNPRLLYWGTDRESARSIAAFYRDRSGRVAVIDHGAGIWPKR